MADHRASATDVAGLLEQLEAQLSREADKLQRLALEARHVRTQRADFAGSLELARKAAALVGGRRKARAAMVATVSALLEAIGDEVAQQLGKAPARSA